MAENMEEEVLNEEFLCYMRVAKSYQKQLRRPKDQTICTELLARLEKFNESKNVEVKRNANCFLKYLLRVLNWTTLNQPLKYYEKWYGKSGQSEVKLWLQENKAYMAMRDMPDGSVAIYCALATNPGSGWQTGGLQSLRCMKVMEDEPPVTPSAPPPSVAED